jgi:hypothetical protein
MKNTDFRLNKKILEEKEFLEWFVGFAEGDGSWGADSKIRPTKATFVINQKDPKVLHKIKKQLGFGSVTGPYETKTGSSYYRYSVVAQKQTEQLIHIFNGKLVLKKTKEQFKEYVKVYNSSHTISQTSRSVEFKDQVVLPTLEDGWLSGFFDAEGCFSGSVRKDWSKIAITLSLVQKGENEVFQHLKAILGGSLNFQEKSGSISRLKIQSISDRERLIQYFHKFPLRSIKNISFCRFKKIHVRITDSKFSWRKSSRRAQERLARLIENINSL